MWSVVYSTRSWSQNVTYKTPQQRDTVHSWGHNSLKWWLISKMLYLMHLIFITTTHVKFDFNFIGNVEVVCSRHLYGYLQTCTPSLRCWDKSLPVQIYKSPLVIFARTTGGDMSGVGKMTGGDLSVVPSLKLCLWGYMMTKSSNKII